MMRDSTFQRICDEVASTLEPVTPLRPAWMSALVAIPIALFLLSLVLVFLGLRSDAESLDALTLWGPASMMVAVGYGILVLALVQRAPESTVNRVWWVALPVLAIALQLGSAYWTFLRTDPAGVVPWQRQAMCFWRISALGLPPVLIVLWLLTRGLPLRPKVAGLLAGLGGGLVSEGVYRLHCGLSNLEHVLPWHTGAVLIMGLLGVIAGMAWERRRLKRWRSRARTDGLVSP